MLETSDAQETLESFKYAISKQVELQANELNASVSPVFIQAVIKVIMYQTQHFTQDMEAFAKHAKRTTISMDDVKLVARRNTHLHSLLSLKADSIKKQKMMIKK